MGMTNEQYADRRRAIAADWPKSQFPGMHAVLMQELEFERAAPRLPEPVTVAGPTESEVKALARQYAASMEYPDALQRARHVLDAEKGIVTDIEHMSAAQLRDYLASSYKGEMSPTPDVEVEDTRSMAEVLADLEGSWPTAQGQPGLLWPEGQEVMLDRVQQGIDEQSGKTAADKAAEWRRKADALDGGA